METTTNRGGKKIKALKEKKKSNILFTTIF